MHYTLSYGKNVDAGTGMATLAAVDGAGKAGTHRLATSKAQVNSLKKYGWRLDDVKMYGMKVK